LLRFCSSKRVASSGCVELADPMVVARKWVRHQQTVIGNSADSQ
jgi:hypothetical protein